MTDPDNGRSGRTPRQRHRWDRAIGQAGAGWPRRPRGHRVLPAAVGVAALLLAAACSSSSSHAASAGSGSSKSSAADVSSVTLNIGDQKGTGAEAVLQAAGLLSKLPFKVHWTDFTSGPPMMQAMGSGSVDIGGVGNAPPVFAAAGGEKVALVGARVTPAAGTAMVVPRNSPITSISQLRGKKIVVAQGSSSDYHLLTVLTKAGLTTHNVTTENLQPAEALAAFNSGHVDAWDVWSPYVEQVVTQNHARILVNGKGYGSNYSFEVASRAALNDPAKAAAIRDYLTILNRAYVWADSHTQAWAKIWGQATGLPDSIMVKASRDSTNTPITITGGVVASEQNLADAFYSAGLVPAKATMSDYTDTSFNDTVGKSS